MKAWKGERHDHATQLCSVLTPFYFAKYCAVADLRTLAVLFHSAAIHAEAAVPVALVTKVWCDAHMVANAMLQVQEQRRRPAYTRRLHQRHRPAERHRLCVHSYAHKHG